MRRWVVLQTDQVDCFDSNGRRIPCAGTGQDGETRAGLPWPAPRFEPAGSVVEDRISGLMWPRNAGLMPWPVTWEEAHGRIAELNTEKWEGFADWRVPTRQEVFTLLSHARFNPALPAEHPFESVFPGYHWTATSCSQYPRQAWYAHLGGGRIFRGMKSGSYLLWPVRSAPGPARVREHGSTPRMRFQRRGAAVLDRFTSLLWHIPASCGEETLTWQAALDRVKELNRQGELGHEDWRLPNVRELESLIDPESHRPAIHPDNPLKGLGDGCWSSTTSVYHTAYAWVIYMENGEVGVGFKAKPVFSMVAVR